MKLTSQRRHKKGGSVTKKKKSNKLSQPPVIFHYLIIIGYASFFGPSIFESIVSLGIHQIMKLEPQLNSVFTKYNQLLFTCYEKPFQFQQAMLNIHKTNLCHRRKEFQSFFNSQFNFEKVYQLISSQKKKPSPNKFFDGRFQQIYICTLSGLKSYVLADKVTSIIWVIFRGTDDIQNMSINLSAELQQTEINSLSAIRLLLNKPQIGMTLGDCSNQYVTQIYRVLTEGIHSIFNGVLYLSQHFLGGKKKAHIYTTGISLGGQLASIFSLMYPRMYSGIRTKYQKLITSRSYCFPISTPKIFQKNSCKQMEKYLQENKIGWTRYFTMGDISRQILLKSKGWYHPQIKSIETSLCYCPKTDYFNWVTEDKEIKKPISIYQLMDSLLIPHQNLSGCLLNSVLHPCFFMPPYLIFQIYKYLSTKDSQENLLNLVFRKEYSLFDFLITKLKDKYQDRYLTISKILSFWRYFLGDNFELIDNDDNLKKCTQIYNYLHGLPDNYQIDLEIFRHLNPNIYQHLDIDINSLFMMMDEDIPGIKGSSLFRDLFFYVFNKGVENRHKFTLIITFKNLSRVIHFSFQPVMKYNTDFLLGDPDFFKKIISGKESWSFYVSPSQCRTYQDQYLYPKNIDIHKLLILRNKTLLDCGC